MLSCSIITVLCFTLTGKKVTFIFSHKKHWKMFSFQILIRCMRDHDVHQWTQAHGLSPTLWFVRGNSNLQYIKRNWHCHWFGNNAVRSKINEEEKKTEDLKEKKIRMVYFTDRFNQNIEYLRLKNFTQRERERVQYISMVRILQRDHVLQSKHKASKEF